ncbi:SPX-domain-containing protein [Hesseltinella vesiculosa]|uniref:SPX-domain-containing protein n=1 Tax=Hesseltinella vesiculosa TaxID=101127 RepID=A0A1X2GTP2_9FUNG|nr:SPX-domain-containing protein [Hesseltinella vesiculosa]
MKFGEELSTKIYEPWRHYYVQYSELSNELKRKHREHQGWTDDDEQDFQDLFQRELVKVFNFVGERMADLITRLNQAETRLLLLKESQPSTKRHQQQQQHANQPYDALADDVAEILLDVNDLSRYHQVNFTALSKLVKRHDKWTHLDLKNRFHQLLSERFPLEKVEFDVLIVRISSLQDQCRLFGQARSKKDYGQGGDQTAFERATSKFWIHPDNITEVKAILLMYLPIHVFNQKKTFESNDAAVSSVYFDNPNYDLYSGRLARSEGAEAVRFRWYGENHKEVYIERKTHHASWLDGKSVKDRFRLKEDLVVPFVQGKYTADDLTKSLKSKNKLDPATIDQNAFIARGIQTSFQEKGLEPMCRVFYNRTAFQVPGDQRLRISLDSNLTFIREDHLDNKTRRGLSDNWRRTDIEINHPFRNVPPQDIVHFPYAVLETKIQTHLGQEAPAWLMDLLSSHLVYEVPRFSKYLHGACTLYKDAIPVLPWWIPELEKDIRSAPVPKVGLSRSQSFKPLFNGHHRRSLTVEDNKENDSKQPLPQQNDRPSSPQALADHPTNTLTQQSTATKHVKHARPEEANNAMTKSQSLPFIAIQLSDKELPSSNTPTLNNEKSSPLTSDPTEKSHGQSRDFLARLWKSHSAFLPTKKTDDLILPRTQSQIMVQPMTPRFFEKVKKPDPKAFFANERTFISWLQFCALLLTVALNLLNNGDHISRIIGAVFIVISSVMSLYALFRFQVRAYQMRTGKTLLRLDDIYGPVVLCVLLVVALLLNFYLRLPMLTGGAEEDAELLDDTVVTLY